MCKQRRKITNDEEIVFALNSNIEKHSVLSFTHTVSMQHWGEKTHTASMNTGEKRLRQPACNTGVKKHIQPASNTRLKIKLSFGLFVYITN